MGRPATCLVALLLAAGCSKGPQPSTGAEEPRAASRTEDPHARPRVATRAPRRPAVTSRPVQRVAAKADPLFAVDAKADLKVRWGRHRDRRWQEVTYRGSAGDRLVGLYRRVRARGRFPAVILGHGHGGDSRSMVQFFGDAFQNQRVHLLAIDHPFHGHARKVRGEDICAPTAPLLVKRFARAVRDLRHAVRVLRSHPRVDPSRIGYLGFSLGAVLGGLLASHEPHLRAAALIAPAGHWPTLAQSRSSWKLGWNTRLLPRWLKTPAHRKLLARVDPARSLARFSPRPLLVVVGRRDRVIRPESGLAVARGAGKTATLWKHVGGHGPGRKLRRRVAVWLAKQLHGR